MSEGSSIAEHRPAHDNTLATTDPITINHVRGSTIRYASLDAVRGIAALSVIFYHTTWLTHVTTNAVARNCYTAVDLFFLLSGFVIAASYQTRVSTGPQIVAFFSRRIFRVYPMQWAVLAWLAAIEGVKLVAQLRGAHGIAATHDAFTGVNSVPLLAANLLLVQGTGLFPETSWNPPSWSVSAEVVAYVVFAATGYLGLLRRPWFVAAIACAGLIAYAILAWSRGGLDVTFDLGIVRCLAGFPIGVLLYQAAASGRLAPLQRLSRGVVTVLEGLTVLAIVLVLGLAQGGWVALVIPCFAALIALFQMEHGVMSQALRLRVFQFLGAISYSLYLVHVPIRNLIVSVMPLLGAPSHRAADGRLTLDVGASVGDGIFLMFVVIVLAVATLTFRFIEEPARLFGRRLSSTY